MDNSNREKSVAKPILLTVGGILLGGAIGYLLVSLFEFVVAGGQYTFSYKPLLNPWTWIIGVVLIAVAVSVVFLKDKANSLFKIIGLDRSNLLEGKAEGIDSPLENSRFLTAKERDRLFVKGSYSTIQTMKKDGIPVRAVMDNKGDLQFNLMPGTHSLVIGASGSGKTTTFVDPTIQLIGASPCGGSMIISDPKGELFDKHSGFLASRGYNVLVLDLRNTYQSSRWNPLESIWNMYREYRNTGNDIVVHRDSLDDYPDLKRVGSVCGDIWCEWNGRAYLDLVQCQDDITVAKQSVYDEMYEDLSDLVSGICPITNEKDPLWEKGARSIILAVCLAMLEDSDNPSLGMTKERFNFYNVNKILTNSSDNYAEVKRYFEGRSQTSQSYSLSRQVMAAPEQTMSSYMSITYDKLSLFNDNGICGLTSTNDIRVEDIAQKPTALFMKIPDEKDTRHGLASLFILSVYKALIKIASSREDLSLPRNVYYILDEFGNMPKIEKFGQMITVGRSRKIWFQMVVQSYAQLNNVYGDTVADIVKANCGLKMFIGSNDIQTCKEFSELCGNMTVKTTQTSSQIGSKQGDTSLTTQTQSRPLIYPSDLQKLNNKQSTGNAIIVTFGNYPLKTTYTPSYRCPLYKNGRMKTEDISAHVFHAEKAFYDISYRNRLIVDGEA